MIKTVCNFLFLLCLGAAFYAIEVSESVVIPLLLTIFAAIFDLLASRLERENFRVSCRKW